MRKRAVLGVLGLVSVLLVTSCATSIRVRHLVPSDVDVSNHRNIAIASTDMYLYPRSGMLPPWIRGYNDTFFTLNSGFNSDLNAKVAATSTAYLVDAMVNTDYFTIMPHETTDAYLTLGKSGKDAYGMLRAQGVDALLRSSITYMNSEERIVGRDIKEWVTENPDPKDPTSKVISYEKVTGRSYYLEQQATVTFTFTLIDLRTNRILATNSFTSQNSNDTYLGKTVFAKGEDSRDEYVRSYSSGFAPSLFPLYESMIREFPAKIARQLAPSWNESRVSLMKNKPKADVGPAYRLAEQGNFKQAYELFSSAWRQRSHLPSGYNAALLLEAMGEHTEALALMNQVYNRSGDPKSHTQLLRLKEVASQQDKAMKQIDGTFTSLDGEVRMTQILTME